MQAHADHPPRRNRSAWYRQPVVWLGILVFAASIAGCVWIIVVGHQHADTLLETPGRSILGVPAAHPQQNGPARPGTGP